MSYNVSYTSIPTFTVNSIGYTVNNSGSVTLPQNSTNVINVCNFSLGIGVYMLTVNVCDLASNGPTNYWSGGISNTNTTALQTLLSTSAQSEYVLNPYFMSSINFTHIISNTNPSEVYVQVQPSSLSTIGGVVNATYNCSITRIA